MCNKTGYINYATPHIWQRKLNAQSRRDTKNVFICSDASFYWIAALRLAMLLWKKFVVRTNSPWYPTAGTVGILTIGPASGHRHLGRRILTYDSSEKPRSMDLKYDTAFFDYVDGGAMRSSNALVGRLYPTLSPASVLDVGCGRGGWLRAWRDAGCRTIQGVDGDYVDRKRLHVLPDEFQAANLTEAFDLGRRFDLVQCLEVAEHIPDAAASTLIESIVSHGDIILFAAAQPGQGGTQHINEQPIEYWRDHFEARGYHAYDCVRPLIKSDTRIEPWYRFNTILYANDSGRKRLPAVYLGGALERSQQFQNFAPFLWRVRYAAFRHLPVSIVDLIARVNATLQRLRRPAP